MKYPYRKNVPLIVAAAALTLFSVKQIFGLSQLIGLWRFQFSYAFNVGSLISIIGTLIVCATGPVLLYAVLATRKKTLVLITLLVGLPYPLLGLIGAIAYPSFFPENYLVWALVPIVLTSLGIVGLYRKSKGEELQEQEVESKATASAPASSLPILALVFAFFFPILGIIFGHVSLSQIDRGLITNLNRGLAKAGLVIGYVTLSITVFVGVAYFGVLSTRGAY